MADAWNTFVNKVLDIDCTTVTKAVFSMLQETIVIAAAEAEAKSSESNIINDPVVALLHPQQQYFLTIQFVR